MSPSHLQVLSVPTHRQEAVTAPCPNEERENRKPNYPEGDAQADSAVAVMLAQAHALFYIEGPNRRCVRRERVRRCEEKHPDQQDHDGRLERRETELVESVGGHGAMRRNFET